MHTAENWDPNDQGLDIRPYARQSLNNSRRNGNGDLDSMPRGFIVRQLVNAPTRVFRHRHIMVGDSRSDPRSVADLAADLTSLAEHLTEIVTAARYVHRYRNLVDALDHVRIRLGDIGANAVVERPDPAVMRDLAELLYQVGDLCNPDPVTGDDVIKYPPRG